MAWNFPWIWNSFKSIKDNLKNGYQFGDLTRGWYGFHDNEFGHDSTVSDNVQEMLNDHGLDSNGNIDINSADPTSSASNVINYDPNKSAQENLLQYAQDNNSASAYDAFLQNKHEEELANSAFSRAIADAEANGISKYQLFQSGNAAAASPSSAASSYRSYESAMDRRNSWNEKELAALTAIVIGTVNSAMKMIGS